MIIQDLIDQVLDLTRRFDQRSQVNRMVISTVRHIHYAELWSKDLNKVDIYPTYDVETPNEFEFSFPDDFRVPHLLVPSDKGYQFKFFEPENLYKLRLQGTKSYDKTAFIHGAQCVGYDSDIAVKMNLSYWAKVIIPDNNFSDWLTTSYPDAIITAVAAKVYRTADDNARADSLSKDAQREYNIILASEKVV